MNPVIGELLPLDGKDEAEVAGSGVFASVDMRDDVVGSS